MTPSKSRAKSRPTYRDTHSTSTLTLAEGLVFILLLSLSLHASQLVLHPLYGSVATSLHFSKVTLAAFLASAFLPSVSGYFTLLAIGLVLSTGPITAFHIGSWTGRKGDPIWGPIITQGGLAIPTIMLAHTLIDRRIRPFLSRKLPLLMAQPVAGLLCWILLEGVSGYIVSHLKTGGYVTGCHLLIGLGLTSTLLGGLCYKKSLKNGLPHKLTNLGSAFALFAAGLIMAFYSKTHSPCTTPRLPALLSNGTIRLLARADSVTGMIIVAENLQQSYRFLRADHSLLGGLWMEDNMGGLGDSIYSAFVLQESVRLVQRPRDHIDSPEKVLIIGLGVGIAAKAFKRHNLHTTVIEIDPAVYNFSREFFGLPAPDAVVLEDARGWVHIQAMELASFPDQAKIQRQYDYVVHDCFSGGSVPTHIYTLEFWDDLKAIMKPDGIVAVNFAGILRSDASRAILLTLKTCFEQCRTFHDLAVETGEDHDFMNMVFFCTPSKDLTFRDAQPADYLGSPLREHIIGSLPQREIPLENILGDDTYESTAPWILTDKHNPLGKWQLNSAIHHWTIMRQVMPATAWESY